MKAVKIILSVLILLLAVVSAVFSYFLYEKRVQFINGWQQLAKAIHASSSNMDKDSGTKFAQILDPAKKISHEQYGDLSKALGEYAKQTKGVIKQRDDMAAILYRIGQRVNLANGGSEMDYRFIGKYTSLIDAVNSAVNELIERRDSVYARLASIVSQYGVTLSRDRLAEGDTSALAPLSTYLAKERETKDSYRSSLAAIARRVDASLSVSDSASGSAAKVVSAVNAKLDTVRQIEEGKRVAEAKVVELNGVIRNKDEEIAGLKKDRADADLALLTLKRSVGLADDFVPWKPGSQEARAHAEGEVVKVSKDYGYFVVNLGTKSVVQQSSKKTSVSIPLALEKGTEIYVVRGDNELVAAVKLDRVGDNESTANIPVGVTIKTGDRVIFTQKADK